MIKEENIIAISLGEQLYTMVSDDTSWGLLLDEVQVRWNAAATVIYDLSVELMEDIGCVQPSNMFPRKGDR